MGFNGRDVDNITLRLYRKVYRTRVHTYWVVGFIMVIIHFKKKNKHLVMRLKEKVHLNMTPPPQNPNKNKLVNLCSVTHHAD